MENTTRDRSTPVSSIKTLSPFAKVCRETVQLETLVKQNRLTKEKPTPRTTSKPKPLKTKPIRQINSLRERKVDKH